METNSFLFQGISLGTLKLKNRIVMAPMATMYSGEEVNERLIDFFRARARGGAGLIIVSHATPHPFGRAYPCSLALWDDKYIPSLSSLAQSIQKEGARAGLHIVHAGKYAPSSLIGTQAVSPSAIYSNWTKEMPRELTREEIRALVYDFAKAVERAKRAGFDLVELNAYSGYLIREFLSPLTNKRQDEYGGELSNRMRFLLEIIAASREEVGRDYPLVVKISGDEFLPGGNQLEEARIIARELEKSGVQALHVSPGGHETTIPLSPGFVPRGAFLYLAAEIKKEVRIPVINAHLGDPMLAEKALAEGKADLVAFGRQFIADPDFPLKLKSGKIREVRRCLRCCQGCYDQVFANQPITCLANPLAGREGELEVIPSKSRKKVLVAGAGPAGMEAAYILALRGHDVHLYERNSHPGGQLRMAAAPPGKEEFRFLIDYFEEVLPETRVKLHLGTELTPEIVERERPEALVIATGAEPVMPEIPGVGGSKVATAHLVLAGEVKVGKRVVVVGGGGTGCEAALYLAQQNHGNATVSETTPALAGAAEQVTLIEMLPSVGNDIGISRRGHMRKTLGKCGVTVITGAKVKEFTGSGVVCIKDGQEVALPADKIVLALGVRSQKELYERLKGKVQEIYLIGDALKPGKAMDAMRQGLETGIMI